MSHNLLYFYHGVFVCKGDVCSARLCEQFIALETEEVVNIYEYMNKIFNGQDLLHGCRNSYEVPLIVLERMIM